MFFLALLVVFLGIVISLIAYGKQGMFYLYHPPRSLPRDTFEEKTLFDMAVAKLKYAFGFVKPTKIITHFQRIKKDDEVLAYFSSYNDSKTTLVYFHGNGNNFNDNQDELRIIQEQLEVNILAVEYPGYGERKGYPSKSRILEGIKQLWTVLPEQIRKKRLYFFGHSIGAAIALESLKLFEGVEGIILYNPFESFKKMMEKVMSKHRYLKYLTFTKHLSSETWNNDEIVKKLKVPCLILAGTLDGLIPLKQKRNLWMICKSDCDIEEFNQGHSGNFTDEVWKKFKSFLNKRKSI